MSPWPPRSGRRSALGLGSPASHVCRVAGGPPTLPAFERANVSAFERANVSSCHWAPRHHPGACGAEETSPERRRHSAGGRGQAEGLGTALGRCVTPSGPGAQGREADKGPCVADRRRRQPSPGGHLALSGEVLRASGGQRPGRRRQCRSRCVWDVLFSPRSTNKYARRRGPPASLSPCRDSPRQCRQVAEAVGRDVGRAIPHQPFSPWKNVALS